MRTKAVNWTEGMLVLPHHFQAEHANLLDWVAATNDWRQPYSYGVKTIDLQDEALHNYEARIPRLQARMKDGTLVSVPENAHLPKLDLKPAFERSAEVYVYLVLPEVASGKSNVSRNGPSSDQRYAANPTEWADVAAGGNPRIIETQLFNARLIALEELESPRGYEALPIAKLKRSSQIEAPPELDQSYIPPLLDSGCWPPLRDAILGAVRARLGSYGKREAGYLKTVGGWSEANQPQVRMRITKLHAVNSAYPYLSQLFQARGVHPFLAYTELCRLVGQLSLFRSDWQPPELPLYDHDDLGRIFRAVMSELEILFEEKTEDVSRIEFVGVNEWMEVALDPKWVSGDYQLFVGVKTDLSPSKVDILFAKQFLDWKLGSTRTIMQIFNTGQMGLDLHRLQGVHPVLPAISDMHYFQVHQEGRYWNEVLESRTLALTVNRRFVSGSFVGTNTITVLDSSGNKRALSFYLFLVRQ